jgi:hypothetical protein
VAGFGDSMTSHKRSVGEQVTSGLIIGGELVCGFLVFVLAASGLAGLIGPPSSDRSAGYFLPSVALIIATVIMFVTAERWGGFVLGFIFLQGLLKGIGWAILGSNRLIREQAALVALYSIAVITMSCRFIPPRRLPATALDRAALTVLALSASAFLVLAQSSTFAIPILLIGPGALLLAWAAYRWRRSSRGAAQQPAAAAGGRRVLG